MILGGDGVIWEKIQGYFNVILGFGRFLEVILDSFGGDFGDYLV